jgi:hypothetical protein
MSCNIAFIFSYPPIICKTVKKILTNRTIALDDVLSFDLVGSFLIGQLKMMNVMLRDMTPNVMSLDVNVT